MVTPQLAAFAPLFPRSLHHSYEYFTAPFDTSQTYTDVVPAAIATFLRFQGGGTFPWAISHVYRRFEVWLKTFAPLEPKLV
jgi:hypothetical protein